MTVVAKLGSSIVADEDGALRSAVLDSVCGQVAELHHGGENVVLVTSGAIARGMRLLELDRRPSAIDEMQAASAVGQGSLFRAYEERLATQDVHAAQVLLTSFDMSARMHYLNARQTLRRLLDWRVVPVVNENDTTATDEITFGDNDFLSAQVAMLLEARLLVLLTDTAGLHTADPRTSSDAELVEEVKSFGELQRYEIGDQTSAFGSGGMRSKVAAAEMASAAGIPVGGLRRNRDRELGGGGPGRTGRHALQAAPGAHPELQAVAPLREAEPGKGGGRRGRGAGAARARLQPAAGRDHQIEGEFAAGDAVEVVCDGEVVGKGIVNYSAAELGRIRGLKSAQVLERMPNAAEEAVHRDYFVLT